jgi:hypothetical protein
MHYRVVPVQSFDHWSRVRPHEASLSGLTDFAAPADRENKGDGDVQERSETTGQAETYSLPDWSTPAVAEPEGADRERHDECRQE